MSIELRYHPLIPNRTCNTWDCPLFKDITFEDITVTGAARAGDINGFKGDLLQRLTFRNVTFKEAPKEGWTCGYVDPTSFVAVNVNPPLTCSSGPSGWPQTPSDGIDGVDDDNVIGDGAGGGDGDNDANYETLSPLAA